MLVGALILLFATEWASLGGRRSSGEGSVPSASTAGGAAGPSAATSSVPESSVAPSAPSSPGITGGPTPVRAFGVSPIPPPPPDGGRSPLADHLNDPARTAADDLAAVAEIFANYLEHFRELPVGTNAEITAALAGDNIHGHAPLPADSPAISPAGELLDRWGTPYFFHQLARDQVEIRSAGPDRRHFTADDIVWPRE